MSENIILNVEAANAVVTMVNNQLKREKVVYPKYIAENGVTLDNLADHVKALTELAYPGVKPSNKKGKDSPEYIAKNFQNKVRNGLKRHLDGAPEKAEKSGKYITAEGLKAESWEAFLMKAKQEWDAANGTTCL